MRLAIVQEIADGRGNYTAIKLERDLDAHKERLANIALEYYSGHRDNVKKEDLIKIKSHTFLTEFLMKRITIELNDEQIKKLLAESILYAFNYLENELRKETVRVI